MGLGGGVGGPRDFSVSPRPLGFGFWGFGVWGLGVWCLGLTIISDSIQYLVSLLVKLWLISDVLRTKNLYVGQKLLI